MGNGALVDVAGVICFIPAALIKHNKLTGKITDGQVLTNIAFSNLIFSEKKYLLRFVTDEKKQKKISHGDKISDFAMCEVVSAVVIRELTYKKQGGGAKKNQAACKVE